MKRNSSIKVKAAILLTVFSLNTVIGFACAIGLKEALTSDHHGTNKTKAVVHVHADGKKHIHYNKEETKRPVHIHADGKKHIHHEEAIKPGENKTNTPEDLATKNNSREHQNKCCTTKVTEFEQLDKYVSQTVKINPIFFTMVPADLLAVDILYTSYINRDIKYFVRSYHPPIPNIRIAIQSFQI
jgi:hypothetical protein